MAVYIKTKDGIKMVSNEDITKTDIEKGLGGDIPRHLQNKHFDGEDAVVKGQHYLYPHDYPNRWVKQQYLPDALKNKKYYNIFIY